MRRHELPEARLRLIQVAKRQLGLDDETYRAILERVALVRSSKDLCPAGFELVMEELNRLGFKSTSPLRPIVARKGMATPGQTSKIRGLWQEVTGGASEKQLGTWLEGHFQVSALPFVDRETAPRVIAALLGWRRRLAERAAKEEHAA